jgi:hypothetical protein
MGMSHQRGYSGKALGIPFHKVGQSTHQRLHNVWCRRRGVTHAFKSRAPDEKKLGGGKNELKEKG